MQIRNNIHLIGHLGAAPQQFQTKDGRPFYKFSLATSDYYKNTQGERVDRTEWHTVMVFGKQGERVSQQLDKGAFVKLVGTMRYRSWTDKHDQKRRDAVIHLNQYTRLDKKSSQTDIAED